MRLIRYVKHYTCYEVRWYQCQHVCITDVSSCVFRVMFTWSMSFSASLVWVEKMQRASKSHRVSACHFFVYVWLSCSVNTCLNCPSWRQRVSHITCRIWFVFRSYVHPFCPSWQGNFHFRLSNLVCVLCSLLCKLSSGLVFPAGSSVSLKAKLTSNT